MSEYLLNILEVYKARSGDEENFMKKHTDNVDEYESDGAKVNKKHEKNAKYYSRAKHRKGYEPGEDEDVYEEVELTDEEYESYIDSVLEDVFEELTDEEREIMTEMLESDEGREEFFNSLFEAKCEDDEEEDDDDEEDDDEDDEEEDDEEDDDGEVEVNPKMNKEKKGKMNESFVAGFSDAPFARELGFKAKGAFAHHPSVEEEDEDSD